ncbi:uncharacterized protein BDZ99DRAFT_483148 [Mytilinidion resinicola]|uniref:Mid2 domain-containing protein n=1 Tax=Mytilinidion resinicola TaxID=574789 RepID=A0A6A6Y041_9PEZI|nr:uncharacterized protein BDZ99DRAFT_483148 [Mytilinidion resinicola]KAF2802132.1 hypothetical protein BDZ99DRAFT_483148 [Mytilinidion resinicola]
MFIAAWFSTRRTSSAWLFFIALFCFSIHAAASNLTCYYPDGLENRGDACNPTSSVSQCCGPGFVCLGNGLCLPGPEDTKSYDWKYYRSGCTDPIWASPTCPNFCLGPNDSIDSGQGIQSCSGGPNRYCCAHSRRMDCCSNSTNIFTLGLANIVTTIPYISKAASTTAPPSITLVPGPSSGSGGVSKSVSTGVGVGVGVGGALAIILGVLLFLRHRQRKMGAKRSPEFGSHRFETRQDGAGNDSGTVVKDAEFLAMRDGGGEEIRAYLPSSPLELESSPRFELGVLPDHDERAPLGKKGDEAEERNKYPGKYFKEEGLHRHEVPG